jgi:hypothetical protein
MRSMEARKKAGLFLTVLATAALLLMAFEWLADQTVPELKEHVVHYVDQHMAG